MSRVGLVETGEAPTLVTLHSRLVLPHRIQADWHAYGLGWKAEAA